MSKRRWITGTLWGVAFWLASAAAVSAAPLLANAGSIQSLTATGAAQPGDTISVSSSIRADSSISNSNLSYQLIDPSGAVVDTRMVDLPRFKSGDTYPDSWQSSSIPSAGTYTVSLCWSTGNSTNCNIDQKSTQFYSVPTLGWPLTVVAAGLLAVWLWRRRAVFKL